MNQQVIEIIEKIVCEKYNVKPVEIRQKTRVEVYLLPRQVVIGIASDIVKIKDVTSLMERYSLDRTSYYNSKEKAHDRCVNKEFSKLYNELRDTCVDRIRANGFSDVLFLDAA